MSNKLQDWIYDRGGYFWFKGWSHKEVRREAIDAGWSVTNGVRWKWLVRLLRLLTGRKFSYWKDLSVLSQELGDINEVLKGGE